jgi:hypothetical protein
VHDPIAVVADLAPTADYMDEVFYGTLTALQKTALPEIWGRAEITLSMKEIK